ncbi:MAG: peptidoglycan DD-metalloendopeptidase family protein [bacterium]
MPVLVYGSFFSDMLQSTTLNVYASTPLLNSQTVPLLLPAINQNPSPRLGDTIAFADGEALLPQQSPSGIDIESRPVTSQISVYVVRPGDTLSNIATMFKVSVGTIVGANSIKGGVIHEGQELIILPITGIEHTVLGGDTLAGLAKKFNSDAGDIAAYNNLSGDADLVPGDVIIIPNGEIVAAETPSKSAVSGSKAKAKSKIINKIKKFVGARLHDAGGPDLGDYYAWPVAGGIITQSLHGFNGVDIGAPTGTSIYASAAGTVIIALQNGGWNGGYGNYIVIQHDNGTQTLYSHASKVLVSPGDSVGQGDLIAKVGRTGEATGPHLHFEVRGAKNPFGGIPVGQGE